MAKLLDKILIIDVEATCWNTAKPIDQENDIIEIGVCVVDLNLREITENKSIIVRPENSTVSDFCTELTTLTQEDVDKGLSFKEACKLLEKEYLSKRRTWGSWGDYDRNQFQKQCERLRVGYPFTPSHINIKNLFSVMNNLEYELGMSSALEKLGLPLLGTHHRGIDDANNIAKIFLEMMNSFKKIEKNKIM